MIGHAVGPVRPWVTGHAADIEEIDPILAGVSPEAAVAVVRQGGRFDLAGHNGVDWELQAWTSPVAQVANDVALSAIEAEQSTIVDHLAKLPPSDCEEFPAFLLALGRLNPTPLEAAFFTRST